MWISQPYFGHNYFFINSISFLFLPSIWPHVFVFSYFSQKSSYGVQRPLILKMISSTLTLWKHMLNMLTMSRQKADWFEIFITALIGLSGGDKHRQLGVPKNPIKMRCTTGTHGLRKHKKCTCTLTDDLIGCKQCKIIQAD